VKLADVRSAYEELTGTASSLVRQLAFAGIGLIWAFRLPSGERLLPGELVFPAFTIVAALSLDFVQYVVQGLSWAVYYRVKEWKGIGAEEEFEAPSALNWLPWTFWALKVTAIAIAYISLGTYLARRL
jgi:hypothetical protein